MGSTMSPEHTGLLRSLLAASGSITATCTLGTRALGLISGSANPTAESIVAGAAVSLGACAAGVLAVGSTLLLVATATGALGRTSRALEATATRLTPALLRRALAVTVGSGLGLVGATGAQAFEPDPTVTTESDANQGEAVPADPAPGVGRLGDPAAVLDWAVTTYPDVPAQPGPVAEAPPAEAPPAVAPAAPALPATSTVTVAPGDCLWFIAASHLRPGATDAEIAAAWPRWYTVNRSIIGPDPGLIHPGQVLLVPEDAQ